MHWGAPQRCHNVTSGTLRYESDRWRSFSVSSFGLFFFSLVSAIFGMQKLHSVTHRSVKHKCWETDIVSLTSWSLQPPAGRRLGAHRHLNVQYSSQDSGTELQPPPLQELEYKEHSKSLSLRPAWPPSQKVKNILCHILTGKLTIIASGHPIYPYLCSRTEVQRSNAVTTLQVLKVVQKWLYTEGIHSSE